MDAGIWGGLVVSVTVVVVVATVARSAVRRRRAPRSTSREAIASEARKAMQELHHDADKARGKARPLNGKGKHDDNVAAANRWGSDEMRSRW